MRMALRFTVLAASSCLMLAGGCEEPAAQTPMPTTAAATTSPAVEAGVAATLGDPAVAKSPRKRLSLQTIPLSIEVPVSWDVQPGVTGRPVLRGKTPNGEVDVLLGAGPSVRAESLPLMLKQSATSSNDPRVKNEVTQRDGMAIIQRISPQTAPGVAASTAPELIPIGWNVQCIITDAKTDYSVYELNILGLSQAMFDQDQGFLRELIESIRLDTAATRPAVP